MHKILLVEDSKALKLAGVRILTKAGYEVLTAEDGEQALAIAQNHSPHLILLDMMLPKVSGLEVLARLKRDPATAHISVIVMTALSSRNEEKLLRDGAAAFIGKDQVGDDPQSLLDMVEKVLKPKNAVNLGMQQVPDDATRPVEY